jgi:hypothetical protein
MTDNRDGMGAGVFWGSLAATLALVLQLPLLDNGRLATELLELALAGLVVMLVTLVVTLAIVGLAALVIGLPVVALLTRFECDGAEVRALAGGLAGYGVILASRWRTARRSTTVASFSHWPPWWAGPCLAVSGATHGTGASRSRRPVRISPPIASTTAAGCVDRRRRREAPARSGPRRT